MEITGWELYWILKLDTFGGALIGLSILTGLVAGLNFVWWGLTASETAMVIKEVSYLGSFSHTTFNEMKDESKEELKGDYLKREKDRLIQRRNFGVLAVTFSCLFCVSFLSTIFIPSTGQMAAIKIGPALLNSKTLQEDLPKEAGDLYKLAKDYLKKKAGE